MAFAQPIKRRGNRHGRKKKAKSEIAAKDLHVCMYILIERLVLFKAFSYLLANHQNRNSIYCCAASLVVKKLTWCLICSSSRR